MWPSKPDGLERGEGSLQKKKDEFKKRNKSNRIRLYVEGQIRMTKSESEITKGNTENWAKTKSRFIVARQIRKNSIKALGKCGEYKPKKEQKENWNTCLIGGRAMFIKPEVWEKKIKAKGKHIRNLQIVKPH